MSENDVKIIKMKVGKKKEYLEEEPDEIKNRKVTENWTFDETSLSYENQYLNLCLIDENENDESPSQSQIEIRRQINYKIHSYRSQDLKKNKYDESLFVNYDYVVSLLREKNMKCFYCKENVMLLYNAVREDKQWTLDRMDNSKGHNRGNVEIACLLCNLRRRTMYHERYVFTKQLNVVKM
jgi:hypothetical protein